MLVLVPVKAFGRAKVRLAEVLDGPARAALAREMADRVLTAAAPLPVAVVCDDDGVAAWAESRGARVLWRPGHGLNGAVNDAVATLAGEGVERVMVTHADLPLATGYDELLTGDLDGVVLVPDRHEDGTNVAVVPADSGFTFAYGPGSFGRHCDEAERLGLGLTVHRPPRLTWDVDVPADLDLPPEIATPPLLPT
jgi:2-phospho-L-lactate/phosphoenolpyruvate guanylyltransferase